ncbi:MAG: hypothetical protein L6V93_23205 [Clostridiales bacterium]|nr:MAG: hypothetical protein L6V93_23205 [Clostridiales bacterium]
MQKCVIIIGNEANGISKEVLDMCTEKVIIPMVGGCESLNAAVSCSVCVYEALRQKNQPLDGSDRIDIKLFQRRCLKRCLPDKIEYLTKYSCRKKDLCKI